MRKGKHNKKSLKGRSIRGGEGEGNYSPTSSETGSVENVVPVENVVAPTPVPTPVPDQAPYSPNLSPTSSWFSWPWKSSTPAETCKKSSLAFWDARPLCPATVGGKRRHKKSQRKHYNRNPNININGVLKVYSTKNITRKRLHTKRR
jgi:hypothetical protein